MSSTVWTADPIIQLVFTILYAILLVFNVLNILRHGAKKEAGYLSVGLVSLCISIMMSN
jgi:hypothetical protein